MAGQITHILAGERALERSSPELGAAVLREQGAMFRLGCQGPDIFYHNQHTKPSGLQYGALSHRRGYGVMLEAAVEALPVDRRLPTTPAGAYILGLATHAAMDRNTHPLIVFYAGWADPSRPGSERYRSCHPFLERLLDGSLLAKWRGVEPGQFDMESLMAPEAEPGEISTGPVDGELVTLWAAGLRAAFPRATGGDLLLERRIANALDDARHFIRMTNPARTALQRDDEDWLAHLDDKIGPRSVALLYPERPPSGIDLESLGSEGWEHPSGDGRRRTATYLDLVAEGVDEAEAVLDRLIPRLRSQGTGIDIAELVGNGGLSVNDTEGRPTPPRISRPLPLAEIMREEYERRLEWARRGDRRH
ncbi:MAG: zinc dependent phospholipase C family protein [Rectinemataceae bacterium]